MQCTVMQWEWRGLGFFPGKNTQLLIALMLMVALLPGCGPGEARRGQPVWEMPWDSVEAAARGQRVEMMMWQGDPLINAYMTDFVRPALAERYGVELRISNGQGSQIVNHLIAEKEAGVRASQLDMVWINGETFYQLRQIDALAGPFVEALPNSRYIDTGNPFIAMDFQQPVEGMECPWGNVQMAFIYDSVRMDGTPPGFAELPGWIRRNPGVFTIPTEFTGMTVLKSWMIALSGDPTLFHGAFDEAVYAEHAGRLWDTLNALKPHLWKGGGAFPESLSAMHQMFAAGELAFTFSNNDSEVDNKIRTGLFPKTARAYFPAPGTIQNSHFLGLVKGGQHTAGALVAINFLISPEAQLKKYDPAVWGDGTVLDRERLPAEWRARFEEIPARRHAPERDPARALMEPAPEYMIRLYSDFRKKVTDAR